MGAETHRWGVARPRPWDVWARRGLSITRTRSSVGAMRNGLVLFTSDHGSHFKTRNSEYKRSCHDSSIRVPTVFSGPGFAVGDVPVVQLDHRR